MSGPAAAAPSATYAATRTTLHTFQPRSKTVPGRRAARKSVATYAFM
jgi:hypothetical protein